MSAQEGGGVPTTLLQAPPQSEEEMERPCAVGQPGTPFHRCRRDTQSSFLHAEGRNIVSSLPGPEGSRCIVLLWTSAVAVKAHNDGHFLP